MTHIARVVYIPPRVTPRSSIVTVQSKDSRGSMSERMVVYVDGFNLYHGLHDWSQCRLLWLDLVELARQLRPRNTIAKVHYFTAPVLNDPGGLSRQQLYQQALKAHNGDLLEVIQGRYQTKTYTCRTCGKVRRTYEEKETDVSIAATIVADAAAGSYDSALLVSADSDMIPAINIARRLKPSQTFVAAFPPRRWSDELRRVLPSSFPIGKARIRSSQLPETVVDESTGRSLCRPAKWK